MACSNSRRFNICFIVLAFDHINENALHPEIINFPEMDSKTLLGENDYVYTRR